ncbi:MAG: UDP-N-acetylmuramoyl-tripeptide--D-alanyl-D-alanine ligase [Winogradskyella sp.]|uniref:UDP-N-acetylmuramoyl-tripeptide--D-alanyl-D- alanine ligase n=1 Tax=Winogradskyella sp. TaxID=1883156 RepID=UPI0025DCAE05|nr:UDP-N-acetylmuramoyl-tripeptide--D-alanyl-D-alanine ligase [Winogradskyella sp.]NRB58325.1 UDP-N-acetylmuramoyl-tripeptide--D-alanyl-D-alanine ligase [Winogradskyella sp.]
MEIDQLYHKFKECSSFSTDTRRIEEGAMYFALKGENFNGNRFVNQAFAKGALYCVIDEVDAKTNDNCIVVEDVLSTLQHLATFHRQQLNIPIISLTGSNGKTTTKELINAVLSTTYKTSATLGNLNNHIGVPLSLLSIPNDAEIGIVEMGANHQKEIEFLSNIAYPDYGLITNFGKAHLEGFGGIQGVIKGKSELYVHLKQHQKTIFVNKDDQKQLQQIGNYDKILTFGDNTSFIKADPFVALNFKDKTIQSQLTGAYNYNNIIAAIAIGQHFNVEDNDIIDAIESYIPNNNRSQIIVKNSNNIILDAYNANPSSMVVALDNFGQMKASKKIAFLGDMFELGETSLEEHQNIADYTLQFDIDSIFLIGENFNATLAKSSKVKLFKTFDDVKEELISTSIENSSILIKGSRGMALERLLEFI